jgi:hypothetical protein
MVNWIKTHKLTAALLVVVGYLLFRSFYGVLPRQSSYSGPNLDSLEMSAGSSYGSGGIALSLPSPDRGVAAEVPASERLVVQNSNLSLLVKEVRQSGERVVKYAEDAGGFMVSTSYNRPDESPFATITVRIPSTGLNEALDYFRAQAIKVTNENLIGTDVTDQYVDIESRLAALERVKAKFESILESAILVQDILTVQRELINTQIQIDNLKGQKQALEDNARFAKLTVFLSTDELSLPYTPDTKFRPNVIFKLAVRSLFGALRIIGEGVIWVAVYTVIWVPALIIFVLFRRWKAQRLQAGK